MKQSVDLIDRISHVYEIQCSLCDYEETIEARDLTNAANKFHTIGWRKIAGRVLCPDCLETMRDDGEDGSYNYDNEG